MLTTLGRLGVLRGQKRKSFCTKFFLQTTGIIKPNNADLGWANRDIQACVIPRIGPLKRSIISLINATMPSIKVRTARRRTSKTVYDVLWSEIERVLHTMPPGRRRGGKPTRTTRH